jgi:hypothetical protein
MDRSKPNPFPPQPPDVEINGIPTICEGNTRTYTVSSLGTISEAVWSMKTDVTLWETVGTGSAVTITAPIGAKLITLRVDVPGNGGGSATITIRVKVAGCQEKHKVIDRTEQGIAGGQTERIHVFPNPTQGRLFIEGTKATDEIILYDLQGRSFLRQNGGLNVFMETQKLPSGLYLLNISGSAGIQHFKIIIP